MKYFIILISLGFLGLTFSNTHSYTRANNMFSADSGGKKPDSLRGKNTGTVPTMWPKFALDSLFKSLGIWVIELDTGGTAPWRHIPWENIDTLRRGGFWFMRDSQYVYKGEGCLKVVAKLGKSPGVPDTIIWKDTCSGSGCIKQVTIPLGRWDTVFVTGDSLTGQYETVCDSVCWFTPGVKDTCYVVISRTELEQLKTINLNNFGISCDTSRNTPFNRRTACIKRISDSTWLVNLKEFDSTYQRPCPVGSLCADSNTCCIDWLSWIAFAQSNLSIYNRQVCSQVVDTLTRINVPCSYFWGYRPPTAHTDTSNCVTTQIIKKTVTLTPVFIPEGRDTTVWVDTCSGCWKIIPHSEISYRVDTTITPVWEYGPVWKNDTVMIDCSNNQITWPQTVNIVDSLKAVYDPGVYSKITKKSYDSLKAIYGCGTPYGAGLVPVVDSIKNIPELSTHVFSCIWNTRLWDSLKTVLYVKNGTTVQGYGDTTRNFYCWLPVSALSNWCATSECKIIPKLHQEFGVFCTYDSVFTVICDKFGVKDTLSVTWPIYGKTGIHPVVNRSIVGFDTTFIRIDTTYITHANPSKRFWLEFIDTCNCLPRLQIGSQTITLGCEPWRLVSDCWEQPYVIGNTIHLPCPDSKIRINGALGSEFEGLATLEQVSWLQTQIDYQSIVNDSIRSDSLKSLRITHPKIPGLATADTSLRLGWDTFGNLVPKVDQKGSGGPGGTDTSALDFWTKTLITPSQLTDSLNLIPRQAALTAALGAYLLKDTANVNFVRGSTLVSILSSYLRGDSANVNFVRGGTLSTALGAYLRADTANANFIRGLTAASLYLRQDTANANFMRGLAAAATFLRQDTANANFVRSGSLTSALAAQTVGFGTLFSFASPFTVNVTGGSEVYTKITGLTIGDYENTFFTPTGSCLITKRAGYYSVFARITYEGTANRTLHLTVFKSGTRQNNIYMEEKQPVSGGQSELAASGIVSCQANDTLDMRLEDETGANNVTINHAQFHVNSLFSATGNPSLTLTDTSGTRVWWWNGGNDSVRMSPTQRNIAMGANDSTTINGVKSNAFTGITRNDSLYSTFATSATDNAADAIRIRDSLTNAGNAYGYLTAKDMAVLPRVQKWAIKTTATTTITMVGSPAWTATATAADSSDTDGEWNVHTGTSAVLSNTGVVSPFTVTRMSLLPTMTTRIKTTGLANLLDSTITFVGLMAGTADSVTFRTAGCFFKASPREYSEVGGTRYWRCITQTGLASRDSTLTSVVVTTNTVYTLSVRVVSASKVEYYIGTGTATPTLVATHTTAANIPAAATRVGYACRVVNRGQNTPTKPQIKWGWAYLEHY